MTAKLYSGNKEAKSLDFISRGNRYEAALTVELRSQRSLLLCVLCVKLNSAKRSLCN